MTRAAKKALAWWRRKNLTTEAVQVEWDPPTDFVDGGEIVAIIYKSEKIGGKMTVYEHKFTKRRRLLFAVDGSCFLLDPPCRITTRGIEG
jgi:hypothetical protein